MQAEPKPPTIVVVEDNADNLLVVEILLTEDVGASCLGVGGGPGLWALLQKQPNLRPDLILLDLQMPREDGPRLLQRLRSMPLFAQARIVAVTANVLPAHVEQARGA